MRYIIDDVKYHFKAAFDTETGAYVRTGVLDADGRDTGRDPFMASYPHLIDVGVMGHCIHGKTGLCAKAGFSMDTVTHDAHVDQVRIGGHKRIPAGIPAVCVQNAGADICAGLRVKGGLEVIFYVVNDIAHGLILIAQSFQILSVVEPFATE